MQKFAKSIIEVGDNLQRATETVKVDNKEELKTNAALKQLFEGVELTESTLLKCFQQFGIEKIVPSIEKGEKFDPNFHEAMFQMDSQEPKDTVVHVMQNGWKIKDRVSK